MLKRISGLLILLLIAQTSASAPLAYAASDTVLITHLQAGVSGGATQEFIGLFNVGDTEVEVTNWCLQNKNDIAFACFIDYLDETQFIIPAQGSVLIASESFMESQQPGIVASLTFKPLSSSSGSIVGSNDRISLVKRHGEIVDTHSWTSSNTALIFQRLMTGSPAQYVDTDGAGDWASVVRNVIPVDQLERRAIIPEPPCEGCEPLIEHPIITELLPNATGADEGKEFIELYNPSDNIVDLAGYELWIGLEPKSGLKFPEGAVIEPGSYVLMTHAEMNFSLVNTSGKVTLKTTTGEVVAETEIYDDPSDDESWVNVGGIWQYTSTPTPAEPNIVTVAIVENNPVEVAVTKPCAANQYRSPETGRCRLIATTAAALPAPCKSNQYRSPETNRCRNIAVASVPVACKEGQERNVETGRCRNIKQMSNADYGVLAANTSSQPNQWYIFAAVIIILIALISYAIWEWREELKRVAQKSWHFIVGQK